MTNLLKYGIWLILSLESLLVKKSKKLEQLLKKIEFNFLFLKIINGKEERI